MKGPKNKAEESTADSFRAIIDLYKRDIDRSLIRENLKLTVEQRLLKLQNFQQFALEIREAGRKLRKSRKNASHYDQ